MKLQKTLPYFAVRGLEWYGRFAGLGMLRSAAIRAAASTRQRRAYIAASIAYLPPGLRRHVPYLVDVGANEGQWLSALLEFATVDRLDAFEPHPAACRQLRDATRHLPSARVHQLAAGARAERRVLHGAGYTTFSSLLPVSPIVAQEYEVGAGDVVDEFDVEVAPLDAVLTDRQPIDLLKLDVQGFERQVLAGAGATLRRTRVLLMETMFVSHYVGDDSFADLYQLVTEKHGFKFWNLAAPIYSSSGQALWADAVFINPTLEKEASS